MTLKYELLKNQGKVIKVGASEAFFYCGLCDKNAVDTIEQAGKESREGLEKRLEKVKARLDNFEEIWDRRFEYVIAAWVNRDEKHPQTLEKYLNKKDVDEVEQQLNKDKEYNYNYCIKVREELTEYLNNYKPFLERQVLEIYESIDPLEDVDLIIIFEGMESGKYWTVEEYSKGVVTDE